MESTVIQNRTGTGGVLKVASPVTDALSDTGATNDSGLFAPAFGTGTDTFAPNPVNEGGMISDENPDLMPEDADSTDTAAVPADSTEGNVKEASKHIWRITPVLGTGYAHDSNIYLSNTNPIGTTIFSMSAGGVFEAGDYRDHRDNYIEAGYLGIGNLYGSASSQNSYNQFGNLSAQYRWERLRVQWNSLYSYANMPNRYSGGFLTTLSLFNSLRCLYEYSEKTALECALSQRSSIYTTSGGYNSYFNQVLTGADYTFTRKVRLGLEGIVGSNPAEDSPTRYYQIVNGRLRYDISGKLSLKAAGGLQGSEYASGGAPFRITPVLSLGADYKLFADSKAGETRAPDTGIPLFGAGKMRQLVTDSSISLTLYRNQQVSPNMQGQDYIATGAEIGFNKAFGRHWFFNFSVGWENDSYLANSQNVSATRTDNYFFLKPGITYQFLKHYALTVFYENSMNNSTMQYYTWVDNRAGVELKSSF